MSLDFDLDTPTGGNVQAIGDNILWVRMPLPFELDHINLYLIKDNEGYALVDTGIGLEKTKQLWEEILTSTNIKLTRIIVTHMHPDHIGMAGYLAEKFQVPLYMSHDEYFVGRALAAGNQGASLWQDIQFYLRCGMDEDKINKLTNRNGGKGIRNVVHPIPLSYERLVDKATFEIGEYQWKVMVGRGHSPEHACLYCEVLDVLISGDHILPKITPNIGVYSTEPNANTLALYLNTLPQFKNLPDSTLVLPAHKRPFYGVHKRVRELMEHHYQQLNVLMSFCPEQRTLVECLPALYKRKLSDQTLFFAIAECLSHLNYLVFSGKMKRHLDGMGVYQYHTVEGTAKYGISATDDDIKYEVISS